MAIILGAVALLTGLSALPFRSGRVKGWFNAHGASEVTSTIDQSTAES